jgi:hypothetical protein
MSAMSTATMMTAPMTAPMTDDAEWFSLAEAARVSCLHETTVLRLALAGSIRYRVRGRRTLFAAADVRRQAAD